jgi:methionine-gamma-lyase
MDVYDPVEAMAAARHEFGEHGGVNMSVEASTTFTVMSPEMMPSLFAGVRGPADGCYLYGRHFNPTVYALGKTLAALEGTEAAYCTASGIGAIAATVMQLCGTGDHLVVARAVYGGTFALLRNFLPHHAGIRATFVDSTNFEAVEAAFEQRTRLLYVETMSNPTLVVADLPRLAEIAHRHGAWLVVDNTFCPLVVTPARLGADVVVYSVTKFVNGASDVIAGAICSSNAFLGRLMDTTSGALMLLGPTMDPQVAFDISLRLPHLALRMKEHSRRASFLARRLLDVGAHVVYPGLPSHPQFDLLRRIGNEEYGAGGVLGLDVGTKEAANELMRRLQNEERFGYMAVSLGYFDTLMSCSAASTSSELCENEQEAAGIRPGYVRVSVGYTGGLEERWEQLHRVLDAVGALPHSSLHAA